MSKKNPLNDLGQVVFTNVSDDSLIMTIQILACDEHNDTIHVTDKTGSDWCIKCIDKELSV
jgi:hypothetical protein